MNNRDEYVVCSAIWYQNNKEYVFQPDNIKFGYVLCGLRHNNIIAIHYDLITKEGYKIKSIQGFLTSKNRFVNRIEAGKIAIAAGQIENLSYGQNELFSEDLY